MASVYGFVIKVRDLDKCRAFYRDILMLGNPAMDSNFRTEFELGGGARLILALARKEEELPAVSRGAFWLMPDDPQKILENLEANGRIPADDGLTLFDPDVKCFRDPEDNLFYVVVPSK